MWNCIVCACLLFSSQFFLNTSLYITVEESDSITPDPAVCDSGADDSDTDPDFDITQEPEPSSDEKVRTPQAASRNVLPAAETDPVETPAGQQDEITNSSRKRK